MRVPSLDAIVGMLVCLSQPRLGERKRRLESTRGGKTRQSFSVEKNGDGIRHDKRVRMPCAVLPSGGVACVI